MHTTPVITESSELPGRQFHRAFALIPGVGVALLGALALAGWVLHVEALKSIIPGADPMKPNMATAILLCGGALSLLSRKTLTKLIRTCTAAIATTVIILSALTIGEYVCDLDLGIEHWLMGDVRADPEIPHPGRMAPITAVCFILVGVALFLASRQIQKRLRLPLVGALGGTLTTAGAVPLIGFLLEVLFGPSWNYMGVTPSGLAGAVAFLLLGIGLLELLRSNAHLTWSLDGFTTAGFVGGLTLMVLAAGLTYNFTAKMQQGAAEVAYEQEIRRELNEIEDNLLELEHDQRSYIITGNESLLERWDAKESEIREHLQKLQELEAGESRERKVLRQLAVLVSQRIDRAKQTAEIRRELGLPAAQKMIATGAGAALREQSRGLIGAIASRGDARLRERQTQSDQASRQVFLMLPLGVFVCFAILTLGVFFLNSGAGERKRAEGALKEAERKYRGIFENAVEGIFQNTPEGRFVSANSALARMLGFNSPEELMSARHDIEHQGYVDPELRNAFRQKLETEGFITAFEYEVYRKDGTKIWVSENSRMVSDGKGHPLYYEGSVQDITESKRAEAELRESRAHLQLAVQASNIGPWDWDLTTNQVLFSREWKQQIGYAENEITSDLSEFSSRLHPDDAERITTTLELCMADPSKEYDVEFRMRHKDGTYRWIHTRGSLHYDVAGRPVRMLGCHLDITDRRLAEQELREAKVAATLREGAERYNFLADTVPQIIWTARPDGGVDYFNKAWFDYTGLTLEETKDWGWSAVLHPDDRKTCLDLWTHSFTTGEDYEVECRFKRGTDSAYRWHLGRALPMRDELGEIIHWVGTCTDVDDARCSKEMLQTANDELGLRVLERTSELHAAKEAAETANRAKSEFLANMSHEIRTPMNGIIGMTDLALETKLNRDQREYLGMVKSSAHSLLGLINDILDFSKIEAGKLELEAIGFSLRDCIGGMLKPLGLRADQKGLELVADILPDVPDHLVGDPMRLRQILINLTANAIKFTEQGEVVVKVANQAAPNGESHLHFSVADTGIGIPVEKQRAIFEAFAQADGSTTRTHGGSGLGLSIASQLIQKMHGGIWVESTVGKGTTFHFTARLGVRVTPSSVQHADRRDLQGLRTLVVDDNAVNRRMLCDMLLNWRMKPAAVESGASAIDEMTRAAHANAAYDLVLLDAMMPEMDGFALAEKIHQKPALAGATVMMLSSATPAGSAARCEALGIAGVLTKPVSQSELLDAILIAVSCDVEDGNASDIDASLAGMKPAGSSLRILLAEDNLVNRAVATGILKKEGHVLVHAANGREAVEAFSAGSFDLILMDVQMPEMDGFEATGRIRELEGATGRHTRIVAMTAHAMAGDRERCLAAGMDDYVSKPLRKEDLLRALEGACAQENKDAGDRALPYNREQLLGRCDGDEELMRELVSIFHDDTPRTVQAIGQAVEKRDGPALAAQAHKLMSSLGAFGAGNARTLALRLEKHGQENNFGGAKERFTELERETDKIYAALADFVGVVAA
jgi:PAS domain S-box-containing protein